MESARQPGSQPRIGGGSIKEKLLNGSPLAGPPSESSAQPSDSSAWWNAFRRRWLPSVMAGTGCGLLLAAAAWLLQSPRFTALSLLRVAASEQSLVFHAEQGQSPFEVYRATQQELLTSPFVLTAALRKSDVARLRSVREKEDPAGWLAGRLRVDTPKDTEILEVSLTTAEPTEAAALVNAVVDAYLTEVVDVEQKQRNSRLNELDRAFTEKETEVRNKWNDLRQLSAQIGTGDSEVLVVKQQVHLQRYGELHRQLAQLQAELGRGQADLKTYQTAFDSMQRDGPPGEQVSAALAQDTAYSRLWNEWADMERLTAMHHGLARATLARSSQERLSIQRQALKARMDARRDEIKRGIAGQRMVTIGMELRKQESRIAVLAEQEKSLAGKIDELEKLTEQIGRRSTDVEMMRAEIKQIEEVMTNIARERERLKVELRSATRVSQIQAAQPPEFANQTPRLALSGFAFLLGLFGPAAGIVWIDVRARRVSASEDVVREVGLTILAAVPVIPARAARRLSVEGERSQRWRDIITESIDGVVARLTFAGDQNDRRVILITSAVSGEGKTTLASQLAINLARSGRRTVLVDCDLRRPAIHRAMQANLEPGVTDYLHGECDLRSIAQPSPINNLTVVATGRWSRRSRNPLTRDTVQQLFTALRADYEYVIVDGCPILPVADARFLCRYVDGVIVAVLRDVSCIPKVRTACEILEGLKVRVLGAIAAVTTDPDYYRDRRYESSEQVV